MHILTGYIEELINEMRECCIAEEKCDNSNAPENPNALASAYERLDKLKAIQKYKSRFRA